jgi:hypothetical protein
LVDVLKDHARLTYADQSIDVDTSLMPANVDEANMEGKLVQVIGDVEEVFFIYCYH